MKQRCENPKDAKYGDYGARGIRVCEEWRVDFRNFLRDMGQKPAGLTLDRIDNDGHYCKANCRWATQREQNTNKRNTVFVTVNGQKIPLITAAEKAGITWNCADKRLKRGWTVERTFGIPILQ